MKRSKHSGEHPTNCPACITQAQKDKYPWDASYLDAMVRDERGFRSRHSSAIARNAKNDAMRSVGMSKVRGALGGTYWE